MTGIGEWNAWRRVQLQRSDRVSSQTREWGTKRQKVVHWRAVQAAVLATTVAVWVTAGEEERTANWGEGDTYCELEDLDREERKRKAEQGETPTQTKKKQKKLEAYGSVGVWGKPDG